MVRLFALPFVLIAFHASIQPLPAPLRAELTGRFWNPGCPVPFARLRVLTVTHWGFDAAGTTAQASFTSHPPPPPRRGSRGWTSLASRLAPIAPPGASGPTPS